VLRDHKLGREDFALRDGIHQILRLRLPQLPSRAREAAIHPEFVPTDRGQPGKAAEKRDNNLQSVRAETIHLKLPSSTYTNTRKNKKEAYLSTDTCAAT